MEDVTLVIGTKNLSSWSLRPWLVLRHAEIPFTEVVVALDQPDTASEIGRHSAAGKVPVLHHGDTTVWDSLAITEYLADRWPNRGIWPSDRNTRAVARSAVAEMHSGFATLREVMPMAFSERRPHPGPTPALDADIQRILSLWTDLRQRYADDGEYLCGAISAVDAFYAPVVSRFRTYGVALSGPAADYAEAIWALPTMQEWLRGCSEG
jgi:glutathione S-transferase